MKVKLVLVCIGISLLVNIARCQSSCFDIDPAGCISMLVNDPNMCSNGGFAATACPETCGKCTDPRPLACFHCDDFTSSVEECQETRKCQLGEVCMTGSVTNIHTGEQTFTRRCASEEFCVGLSFLGAFRPTTTVAAPTKPSTVPITAVPQTSTISSETESTPTAAPSHHGSGVLVGRRDVETHCCLNSLCNRAHSFTTTTTQTPVGGPVTDSVTGGVTGGVTGATSGGVANGVTGSYTTNQIITGSGSVTHCLRDIVVGLESPELNPLVSRTQLNNFLKSVISSLAIGANGNLMSLTVLSGHMHPAIGLADYQSPQVLSNAVDRLDYGKANIEVHDILKKLKETLHVERPRIQNALVIIADHATIGYSIAANHGDLDNANELKASFQNIIVVEVGPAAASNDAFAYLATDPSYRLSIPSYADLPSVLNNVLNLLCR